MLIRTHFTFHHIRSSPEHTPWNFLSFLDGSMPMAKAAEETKGGGTPQRGQSSGTPRCEDQNAMSGTPTQVHSTEGQERRAKRRKTNYTPPGRSPEGEDMRQSV